MKFGPDVSVNDVFKAMSEGEKCHMANKLHKEGYEPIKMRQKLDKAMEGAPEVFRLYDGLDLSFYEMIHLYIRLNPSDHQFSEAFGPRLSNKYRTFPKGTNGYDLFWKIDKALHNG